MKYVEGKPLVVLKFDEIDWDILKGSDRGVREFTTVYRHHLLEKLKVPTGCLVFGQMQDENELYLGLIRARHTISTLESRVKIERAARIRPSSPWEVAALVNDESVARRLLERIEQPTSVALLTPKLSSHLVERLASIKENRRVLESMTGLLGEQKKFDNPATQQEDAVATALRTFGRDLKNAAGSLYLAERGETALSGVRIREDAVIEHDARAVSGYSYMDSDLTGRAVFKNGSDRLEIITANRGPLERVLGVDLIYFNETKMNIVMLQYKMLERSVGGGGDWIYRPDARLDEQLNRMRSFLSRSGPAALEYRFNTSTHYLKFVKRDAALGKAAGIILPIEHYDIVAASPEFRGRRQGVIIAYERLEGRYLRQQAFIELMKAGYIGSYARDTRAMKKLIDCVLVDGKSVVAAHQTRDSYWT